jgi:hypothetical protein
VIYRFEAVLARRRAQAWLQWRTVALRGWLHARGGAVAAAAVFVAVVVLTFVTPSWTLRFERVLAWPVVVLIVVLLFRHQIRALLQGRGLHRATVRPVPGGFEPQEQLERAFGPVTADEGLATMRRAIATYGNIALLYEIQIAFLRHLKTVDGMRLTDEAARAWFRSELTARRAEASAVEPLLGFLVGQDLLLLSQHGYYSLTPLGEDFVSALTDIWYSPKAI